MASKRIDGGFDMVAFHSHHASQDCSNCEYRHRLTFCNFEADALADFAKIGIMFRHDRGTKLFSEGEPARCVSVICFGQIKISTTSRDGDTMILKIAGPGDVLGLSALLADIPHETSAEALQPCQVKTIG